ncbi:MAG: DUF4340 domain-containing protein, partial [Planctomycetota bacterium]|nr:DUF4340 domain-containing protein [Planctomycetota bacterium]
MRARYTAIAFLIVAAAAVAMYFDLRRPREKKMGILFRPPSGPGASEAVSRIEITRPGGSSEHEEIVLVRGPRGMWRIEKPIADDAEKEAVEWALGRIESAFATEILRDEDPAKYGLGAGAVRVRLLPESAGYPPFLIGMQGAARNSRYVSIEGGREIFVVGEDIAIPFLAPVEHYRARRLLRPPRGTGLEGIERMEIRRGDEAWSFVRTGAGWKVEMYGTEIEGDAERIGTFARALYDLVASKFLPEAPGDAARPAMAVTVRTKEEVCEVRLCEGLAAAVVSGRPGAMELASKPAPVLTGPVEELCARGIFRRSFREATEIERRDADGKIVFRLEKEAGKGWRLAEGGDFEAGGEEVEVFLDMLTRLKVVSWPFIRRPGEFRGAPAGRLTVRFAPGAAGAVTEESLELLGDPAGDPRWIRKGGGPILDVGIALAKIAGWRALDFHPGRVFDVRGAADIRSIEVRRKPAGGPSWRAVRREDGTGWIGDKIPPGWDLDPEGCEKYAAALASLRAKRILSAPGGRREFPPGGAGRMPPAADREADIEIAVGLKGDGGARDRSLVIRKAEDAK